MKVYIKNKLISLGGSSTVVNEQEQPVFTVKGKIVSPTKKKFLLDMEGNALYKIRNRFWNMFAYKTFIYDADGNRVATIKKGKFSFSGKFEIEDSVDSMSIDGKVFSSTSKVMRNNEPVATILRDFTIISDAFTLEANEEDLPFMVALVIAFDNLKDEMQDN